jgi:regulator of ribonuclease activity A
MSWSTADLCDEHGDVVRIVHLSLRHYGGHRRFSGEAVTAACREGTVVAGSLLAATGTGRVLVVDAQGDLTVAIVGSHSISKAVERSWGGVILNGALRDAAALAGLPIGLLALGTCPRRAPLAGSLMVGQPIEIGQCVISPGDWVYADADGVIVSPRKLI